MVMTHAAHVASHIIVIKTAVNLISAFRRSVAQKTTAE
jgi:hypothetical protein